MIEMKVMGIALDVRTNSPIVVLHDLDNRKALPIWIGSAEASAIIRKIENIEVARPMTHDLIINMVEELGGEKIDIIKYSEDLSEYIAKALSPADVTSVEILDESARSCRVTVPASQLSLAIGNKGQNARLAARLTGWKIDIRSEEEMMAAAEENEEDLLEEESDELFTDEEENGAFAQAEAEETQDEETEE